MLFYIYLKISIEVQVIIRLWSKDMADSSLFYRKMYGIQHCSLHFIIYKYILNYQSSCCPFVGFGSLSENLCSGPELYQIKQKIFVLIMCTICNYFYIKNNHLMQLYHKKHLTFKSNQDKLILSCQLNCVSKFKAYLTFSQKK